MLTELPAMEVVSIFNLNGTAGDQVGVSVSGATAACATQPSVSDWISCHVARSLGRQIALKTELLHRQV